MSGRHGDALAGTSDLWEKACAELLSLSGEGWTRPYETWVYASATTITVPTGAASRYGVGDKIRLKQGSGYLYFYIVTVADTLLTITGGTDYTLANATITDNYFSHQANPLGFPGSFAYGPTPGGFSANPTLVSSFYIIGRRVFLTVQTTATGTSNATTFTLTAPVTSAASGPIFIALAGQGTDNGAYVNSVLAQLNLGSTNLQLSPNGGGSSWTNVGAKGANISFGYNI